MAQKEINELNNLKTKTIFYCKDCGKEISYGATRGIECSIKKQRKTERPSREELKDLIRVLPFTEIGRKYNVTDNAIKKWCDAVALPRTKREINQYSNEDWAKI